MLERYSKRTKFKAVATGISLLVVSASQWFPGLWSQLSDKPFFQWLLEKWPAMTIAVYLYLKLLVYVAALGLLYMILKTIHQQQKDYGWLEDIADEDDKDMGSRIRADFWDINICPSLHGSEPHVDLRVIIQNSTVYTLTLTHSEGTFDLFSPSSPKSSLQCNTKG